MADDRRSVNLRWTVVEDESSPPRLFAADDFVDRHVGTGEYRGMEFLHVNAKRVVNEVPAASRMPFRYTINAYRGCSHACSYCLGGSTPVLMADGRTKALADVRIGDRVYGTVREGSYRRYVPTVVVDHWSTVKPAYRVTLADGTELVASGDHRFLTGRGWKHVIGAEQGPLQRPFLTPNNKLMGTGGFVRPPVHDADFRLGYLCGMIRGDGTLKSYSYARAGGSPRTNHRFRLALVDFEGLRRTRIYLAGLQVATREFEFQLAAGNHKSMDAIRASSRADIVAIRAFIEWPKEPSIGWRKGFLAGIFDAEGSYSQGILRISNTDIEIIDSVMQCMGALGFQVTLENSRQHNGICNVRLLGGLREHLRFFHTVDPAITRKRTIDGVAIKSDADLRVESIESLGVDMPMYDITTGTGDFIANGVVSHNCFARPTHEYLGLGIGEDFDSKIVVKVNAVGRARSELSSPKWAGDHIAMGTNTDPYQKAEGKYHLTRGIVGVLGELENTFSILTKSTLILRDLDVLTAAAARTSVRANFSIGTLDRDVWKLTEPGTPPPDKRVDAVRRLNQAGIACGVLIAPILPGLSDGADQLREVVEACVAAGAVSISSVALHLRPGVREHYLAWLAGARPDLVPLYEQRFTGRAGPRSYQPKAVQEELSHRVGDLVRAAEGRVAHPSGTRAVPVPRRPPAEAERPPPAHVDQLSLGL
ncbi:MAG TPA: LAGLIDADG family homing endonuclease [Acidimicrobiales bacterium]